MLSGRISGPLTSSVSDNLNVQDTFDDTLIVPRKEGERLPRDPFAHEMISKEARGLNLTTHGYNLHKLSTDIKELNNRDPEFGNFGHLPSSPDLDSPSLAKSGLTPRKAFIYGRSFFT